jgi:hypothetical protein
VIGSSGRLRATWTMPAIGVWSVLRRAMRYSRPIIVCSNASQQLFVKRPACRNVVGDQILPDEFTHPACDGSRVRRRCGAGSVRTGSRDGRNDRETQHHQDALVAHNTGDST